MVGQYDSDEFFINFVVSPAITMAGFVKYLAPTADLVIPAQAGIHVV
ncbi:MAG: hypothetical protein ABR969_06645 [Sedimentisphaerales bacterium]|jgi:hypothetical protein